MTRFLPCLLLAVLSSPCLAQRDAAETAFFEKKIRPVLVEHCYKCHAADARVVRGGLRVDSRDGLIAGGDSGAAIVPGQPENSLLLEALRYEGFEMPPKGRLPDAVIADFETWIRNGATDPRTAPAHAATDSATEIRAGRKFWAFQPLSSPPPPAVVHADWPTTEIDRFVLARQEAAGLSPAADADRTTLLRRITFDLTGLPPTPEAVQDFLADDSPGAWQRVVDRLLASRQFGERWGRHWLDVARYSDSTGGGRSALFGTSWRYRNYVIDAFNQDLPYDEFIVEQIAGDLLTSSDPNVRRRQLTATAFLAMGPTNYELQDKKQLRMDVVDEQIDTIGRAFLGMTIGCARCHDHKFDPIPTRDYYAIAGIFRSTHTLIDGNVSRWVTRRLPTAEVADPSEPDRRIQELTAEIARLKAAAASLQSQLPSVTIDDDRAELIGKWEPSQYVKPFVGTRYLFSTDPGAEARFEFTPKASGRYDIQLAYTPGGNREPQAVVLLQLDGRPEAEQRFLVNQRHVPPIGKRYLSLGQFALTGGQTTSVIVTTRGAKATVIADAVRFVSEQAHASTALSEELAGIKTQLAAARAEQQELKRRLEAIPVVMSVEDEAVPEDCHICIRGNVRRPGDLAPRGFLSVITGTPPEIPAGSSGRLQFARWIASEKNPLTARVMVNRVWHHLFGAGIVRTVDNFGVPGERPSDPELLDHLASRFARNNWSLKSLIRQIVLSRAYRQSSEPSPEARRADPTNRLLSHQNRRRLQAEAIRDTILLLSGDLDASAVENSVAAGTKSEYDYVFRSTRRSVYQPVFRNRLHDLLAAFDFPDPNLSSGRRTVSTLSTQALYLMNSPFIIDQSTKLAERLLAIENLNERQRLSILYRQALTREPTSAEAELVVEFLQQDTTATRAEQWTAICQTVIGSVDFRYIH